MELITPDDAYAAYWDGKVRTLTTQLAAVFSAVVLGMAMLLFLLVGMQGRIDKIIDLLGMVVIK